jgi:hypothetical protein
MGGNQPARQGDSKTACQTFRNNRALKVLILAILRLG